MSQPTTDLSTVYAVQVPHKTGPAPMAITLGTLGLVVAALTTLSFLTDLRIDWDVAGPVAIAATGLGILVLGGLGMVLSRRRGEPSPIPAPAPPAPPSPPARPDYADQTPVAASAASAVDTNVITGNSAIGTQRADDVDPPTS